MSKSRANVTPSGRSNHPTICQPVRVVDTQLLGRIEPRLEGCRAGDDLEDRAGRIQALGGPVQERPARVARHLCPRGVLFGPIDDLVRVVRRHADRREDRTGPRIERHDRALSPASGVRRGLLDLEVDPEDDLARWAAISQVPARQMEMDPPGPDR